MLKGTDMFYMMQEEPNKSCFLALKKTILSSHSGLREDWKYRMPAFSIRGKMICYLYADPKSKKPYVGFVDAQLLNHPKLETSSRARMKIWTFNPKEKVPRKELSLLIEEAINLALGKKSD